MNKVFLFIFAVIFGATIFWAGQSFLGQLPDNQSSTVETMSNQATLLPGSGEIENKNSVVSKIGKVTGQGQGNKVNWHYLDTFEEKNGRMIVPYEVKQGLNIAMGDVLVIKEKGKSKNQNTAEIGPSKYWPEGVVPYKFASNFTKQNDVLKAMARISESAPSIQFKPFEGEENYLQFENIEEHCYSYVGVIGGMQPVYISQACNAGAIMHELLHALGLFHEHSRPDRDDFVVIFWDNIDEKMWPQFKKIPENIYGTAATEFDFQSIMMYGPEAFAKDPNYASIAKISGDLYIPNRDNLSALDTEKLEILYDNRRE